MGLFSFESASGKKQRYILESSKEKWFCHLILENINEMDFNVLYSDKANWLNAPVNILVSS